MCREEGRYLICEVKSIIAKKTDYGNRCFLLKTGDVEVWVFQYNSERIFRLINNAYLRKDKISVTIYKVHDHYRVQEVHTIEEK